MGSFVSRIIRTTIVSATVSLIANVLNLSETKVGKILGFAIPMITFFMADDPQLTDLIFKDSKSKRERNEAQRERERDRKQNQRERDRSKDDRDGLFSPEEAEKEFFDIFGEKGHAMSRFIAEETDSTEEEVNGVLGMTFRVMENAFGRNIEEDELDEEGFSLRVKEEAEEEKKNSPGLFRTMTKMIF